MNTTHTNTHTHTSSHETRGNQRVVLPPAKPPSFSPLLMRTARTDMRIAHVMHDTSRHTPTPHHVTFSASFRRNVAMLLSNMRLFIRHLSTTSQLSTLHCALAQRLTAGRHGQL